MIMGIDKKKANRKGTLWQENRDLLFQPALYGMAIGDALGVPYEFSTRDEMDENPCTEMVGYQSYILIPPGHWSDDTSMALATLASLSKGKIDLKDIMKNFVKWLDNAEFACDGIVFDYGNTVYEAINNFKDGVSIDKCGCNREDNNGNGALMRMLPVCLYIFYYYKKNIFSLDECINTVHKISALTHRTIRCNIGSGLLFFITKGILDYYGTKEERIQKGINDGFNYYSNKKEYCNELKNYDRLKDLESFINEKRSNIRSGGYVVDTLEAALWCIITTDNYNDCVLKAVNLGRDTDTTACVAGGMAGLIYGINDISTMWKLQLVDLEYIDEICEKAERSLRI